MARVLVIDDEASMRFTLEAVLGDAGHEVETADGGAAGIAAFEARGADVVITDLAMPDVDGMKVLATMRVQDPGVPVMMLTAHGSERVAVAAMKAGAFDYLPKPFDPDEVTLAVTRAVDTRRLRLENARLRTEASLGRPIVAESPVTRRVLELVARVAPKDVTVLLTGESGVGKDVLAATLHTHSKRADKPLVRFNAAAIPGELAEAELFGHAKGAFTGATQARTGYFQQADKGTLFIDEVGELALPIQAKVLRALQSGDVQPVGGRAEHVDVRLVAATNRDLPAEVKAGRFREDLFYRLNVFPLHLAPLRERPRDILPIAERLIERHTPSGMAVPSLCPNAERLLLTHPWPGNVRELENVLQRAIILMSGDCIEACDLHFELGGPGVATAERSPHAEPVEAQAGDRLDADLRIREQELILEALAAGNGSRKAAAERLGISPRTLRYKLARLREQGVAVPA